MASPQHSADFGTLAADAHERVRRTERLRQELATITGTAASDDGLVRVRCTPLDGVAGIDIDPRALRMASSELGGTLVRLIREAHQDMAAQMRQATADAYGLPFDPDAVPDPQALRDRLTGASALARDTAGDARALVEEIRRRR